MGGSITTRRLTPTSATSTAAAASCRLITERGSGARYNRRGPSGRTTAPTRGKFTGWGRITSFTRRGTWHRGRRLAAAEGNAPVPSILAGRGALGRRKQGGPGATRNGWRRVRAGSQGGPESPDRPAIYRDTSTVRECGPAVRIRGRPAVVAAGDRGPKWQVVAGSTKPAGASGGGSAGSGS